MNLNQLYYFKTIAKLQHFRHAAQELNVSQPSLSHSMSTLESELGTCLFEKQGRNVVLTKYGRVFLEYVEDALFKLELGKEKVTRLTNSAYGNIDLAYVYPLAPSYIPKAVRNFLDIDNNKGVTFTFKQGITPDIINGLKSSKYDLGFCSYVEDEPSIIFEPILKQELIIITPIDHPLAKFNCINLKEIEPYPLIVYEKESGLGKLTLDLFKEIDIHPNIIFEGENEQAIFGLVAENFGVSLVATTPQLSNFNVKQISINSPKFERYIYLAHLKDRYFPPAIKNFIEYVKTSDLQI